MISVTFTTFRCCIGHANTRRRGESEGAFAFTQPMGGTITAGAPEI
jgi:hypothetical protein